MSTVIRGSRACRLFAGHARVALTHVLRGELDCPQMDRDDISYIARVAASHRHDHDPKRHSPLLLVW